MKTIGKIIKSLRVAEDMTQEELANKLKVTRSAVGNWENDVRKPDNETLSEIADIFNVDMNYITGKTTEEYYYDLQTRQIAQEIHENKDLKILFDASRKAKPEDLKIVLNLLSELKKRETGDADNTEND